MNIYLAGVSSFPQNIEDNEFLNGLLIKKQVGGEMRDVYKVNILDSFFYAQNSKSMERLLPKIDNFLLDSGAFTFMNNAHTTSVNWDKYIEDYAEYINSRGIDLFFELDIDSVVGLVEVERLRHRLEQLTNKKPIPVWHISRGKEYFLRMCKEYPYVSLGGIVGAKKGSALYKQYQKAFPWFIDQAHKNGCKIHGLGYTSIDGLKRHHFDSVDSTAWLYGNRGGYLFKFDSTRGKMEQVPAPEGFRLKARKVAMWNFNEWIKFQVYAGKYL